MLTPCGSQKRAVARVAVLEPGLARCQGRSLLTLVVTSSVFNLLLYVSATDQPPVVEDLHVVRMLQANVAALAVLVAEVEQALAHDGLDLGAVAPVQVHEADGARLAVREVQAPAEPAERCGLGEGAAEGRAVADVLAPGADPRFDVPRDEVDAPQLVRAGHGHDDRGRQRQGALLVGGQQLHVPGRAEGGRRAHARLVGATAPARRCRPACSPRRTAGRSSRTR